MTAGRTTPSRVPVRSNPYVGPFPFNTEQRLPNRGREAQELADLLVAERVVLLHAPSGAGKTSLIHAAVIPRLTGFSIAGPVRVGGPIADDDFGQPHNVRNRYVQSIALSLLNTGEHDAEEIGQLTLVEVVKRALPPPSRGHLPLLVLDQFEEILTLDPTDWPVKKQFFEDLGDVVEEGGWVLLAMREDFMGGLDRYLRHVPGHLRTRYRLDFLTHKEATAAIQKPASDEKVRVTDEAAEALVEKLRLTEVEGPEHSIERKRSPYVEPVLLQVVCHGLWKDVDPMSRDFQTIEKTDVETHVHVDRALGRYFDDSIREIVDAFKIDERQLRDWFENELITPQGVRSQSATGPDASAQGGQILTRLTELFLINSDTRGTNVWYELAHDRLVKAVWDSNRAWRIVYLADWQNRALEWQWRNRRNEFLLAPDQLRAAPSAKKKDLADFEREFLEASEDQAGNRFRLRRYQAIFTVLALIALTELVFIIILLILLLM